MQTCRIKLLNLGGDIVGLLSLNNNITVDDSQRTRFESYNFALLVRIGWIFFSLPWRALFDFTPKRKEGKRRRRKRSNGGRGRLEHYRVGRGTYLTAHGVLHTFIDCLFITAWPGALLSIYLSVICPLSIWSCVTLHSARARHCIVVQSIRN